MKSNTELLNDLFGYFDEIFSNNEPDRVTDKDADDYFKDLEKEEDIMGEFNEDGDWNYTAEDFDDSDTPDLNPGGGPYNPADNI